MYDVIIVGGGPAGLSAAQMLGRCRRRTVVCDAGQPRNAASRALHGFLTRDGIAPQELLRLGREELAKYGVDFRHTTVSRASRVDDHFELTLEDGSMLSARVLLLATGMVDRLPAVEGLRECYGRSAFHCPYCDAWEVRDQPIAVLGRGAQSAALAIGLKTWTDDVVLCTNGHGRVKPDTRQQLARLSIIVREEPVIRLEHEAGMLKRLMLADGSGVDRRALFFVGGQAHRSDLVQQLDCALTHRGVVKTGNLGETSTPGLYVVGDASRDVQLAIVAASEGVKAAFAINRALQMQQLHAVADGRCR